MMTTATRRSPPAYTHRPIPASLLLHRHRPNSFYHRVMALVDVHRLDRCGV